MSGALRGQAACRHFGLHRSTFAYQAKQPDAWLSELKSAVRRVSNQYPEMGYPKFARLLKREAGLSGPAWFSGFVESWVWPFRLRRPSEGVPLRAAQRRREQVVQSALARAARSPTAGRPHLGHDRAQLLERERLRHHLVHPGRTASFPVGRGRITGERDDVGRVTAWRGSFFEGARI